MDDNTTLKELELSAKNCKRQMDRLNRAYYGMTVDEIIRSFSSGKDRTINPPNKMDGGDFDEKE